MQSQSIEASKITNTAPVNQPRPGLEPIAIACLSLLALAQTLTGVQVQGLPFLYPMRHTAAMGLLCIALSLWGMQRGWRGRALVPAAIGIVIALSALAAQAMRWMQLIDDNPAHPIVGVANFIHTALPNSVCLLGLGSALCALARARQVVYPLVLSALVGGVVATFAVCALLNEIGKLIPASPAFEGEVAVDAVLAFALAGIALLRMAQTRLARTGEALPLRRSLAIAVTGTVLAFVVWRILLHERTVVVADQTTSTAGSVARAIRSAVASRTSGLNSPDAEVLEVVATATRNIADPNYQVFFVRDGGPVYSFPNLPRRHERSTVAEVSLPELGGTVRLHPGSQFVRRGASWASHLVLAFGFLSSVLLAFSAYLVQVARERVAQVEREIVERQRIEQELNQQAKLLTASNAHLEEFAHVVSHDLQEPLRSIGGFAQLLVRRYEGRLDSDADEFLGYITDSAQRMSKMITGLLTYSRTVYGQERKESVDLNEALRYATGNLALAIDESGVAIDADPLPVVRGNSLQLAQLFQNLVGNAIKYRRPAVEARIEIRSALESGEHVITVRDNGLGIPEEFQGRIFGLFHRAHGREYSGSGVGLAVCKRVVETHGGRIWLESTPGCGSTFYFTLPEG